MTSVGPKTLLRLMMSSNSREMICKRAKSYHYRANSNLNLIKFESSNPNNLKSTSHVSKPLKTFYSTDQVSNTRISSNDIARQFINTLTPDERRIIKDQLIEVEKEAELLQQQQKEHNKSNEAVPKPTLAQLISVSFQVGLPFIGFGFVDNFLMIIAGDFIESSIGVIVPISTMAAAGLGNAVSDVVGISLAHHIESFSMKVTKVPKLTPEQWNLPLVNWLSVISKSLSIFFGCVIGMAPLLFMNEDDDDKKEKENKTKN